MGGYEAAHYNKECEGCFHRLLVFPDHLFEFGFVVFGDAVGEHIGPGPDVSEGEDEVGSVILEGAGDAAFEGGLEADEEAIANFDVEGFAVEEAAQVGALQRAGADELEDAEGVF